MEQTGFLPWAYEQHCNNANIYTAILGTFLDTDARYGTTSIEGHFAGMHSQRNISTCGAAFIAACGTGAAACVGSDPPYYPRDCNARYDGAFIATFYSLESRKSVGKHELQHCISGRAEDYDDDQSDGTTGLRCIPSTSIMGCGPNHPNDYSTRDDALWRERHYPGFLHWAYLFPCQPGTVGVYWATPIDPRATRVSIIYWDFLTNETGWAGGIVDAPGRQVCVPLRQNSCLYARAENAVSWYASQNLVLAGCT